MQSFKHLNGFKINLWWLLTIPSRKIAPNNTRFFANTRQRCIMSVFFLFQKVYQYAMCTLKQDFCLRGMPLSCQFFLLFRDCKSKCQQHLNAVTHSSLQPVWYWLFLTFALTCHQKLGRNSFRITITKGLSPKFSWGWGRKNMKEGQVWIYQLAFWNNPGTFFLN